MRIVAGQLCRQIRPCLPSKSFTMVNGRLLHTSAARRAAKDEPAAPATNPRPPPSSCPANTVMTGINYLKGQPPVLALPDEEYPEWLWTITSPRPIPDDGPGGKGEKMRMRIENRKRIKEQNFMSKQ